VLAVLLLSSPLDLPGQAISATKPGSAAAVEKTAEAAKKEASEVDRDALRKEAKARREAERRFSEQSVPTQPFQQSHFPENF
jgi:hypothetical protein